jgi:hypothetical protein
VRSHHPAHWSRSGARAPDTDLIDPTTKSATGVPIVTMEDKEVRRNPPDGTPVVRAPAPHNDIKTRHRRVSCSSSRSAMAYRGASLET